MSYWRNELHEQLREVRLHTKWNFGEDNGELRGTELNALEYLDKLRCEMLYSHECSPTCREKGSVMINLNFNLLLQNVAFMLVGKFERDYMRNAMDKLYLK